MVGAKAGSARRALRQGALAAGVLAAVAADAAAARAGFRIGGNVPLRCELGLELLSVARDRAVLQVAERCNAPFALEVVHDAPPAGLRFVYAGRAVAAAASGRTRLAGARPPSWQSHRLEVRLDGAQPGLRQWLGTLRLEPLLRP